MAEEDKKLREFYDRIQEWIHQDVGLIQNLEQLVILNNTQGPALEKEILAMESSGQNVYYRSTNRYYQKYRYKLVGYDTVWKRVFLEKYLYDDEKKCWDEHGVEMTDLINVILGIYEKAEMD